MLQFLYLFVTYNFCTTICYTAINLPYGSLSSMMIRESSERDKLSVLRMGLSPIGKIVAATCTLPLVKLLGNDQAAWIKVMSVWAVLALALLLLCFFKCEEKVQIEARKKDEKLPVPTMLKALFTNQYFWAVMILWTVQSVSFTITGTILPYYCKYIFNNDTWMYSALFLTETLVLVVGIFVCSPLIKKFRKKKHRIYRRICCTWRTASVFLEPIQLWLHGKELCYTCDRTCTVKAVVFSMVGDVVEFGQWKNHTVRKA